VEGRCCCYRNKNKTLKSLMPLSFCYFPFFFFSFFIVWLFGRRGVRVPLFALSFFF
jgi:glucan phosphoethanolaminetransferase (alkaline phosphatase superfamily)